MDDVTPELLKKIQDDFRLRFDNNKVISELYTKVKNGAATYKEANEFAIEVGNILAAAYKNNLSSQELPDGKMYYNIAQRIINTTLKNDYDLVTDITSQIQQKLNKTAGLGIRAITPEFNQDKADGIINRVSSADSYDDAAWILDEPVKVFSQSIVDDAVKVNAEFHAKAGLTPKITRKSTGKCCKWCNALAGTYSYPNVPKDIWRRHQRCRCIIDYDPGNGKTQNVQSKKWQEKGKSDKILKAGSIPESDKDPIKTEYRKYIGKNGLTYAESKALTDYMSFESYLINNKLREESELTDEEILFCKNLDSALKKIPVYKGDLSRSLFFYSDEDAKNFVDRLSSNKIISFKEYISTTKSAELYNQDANVHIFISNSKKGHDITWYNKAEKEVLYERNSLFKTKSIVKKENIWYILLEEAMKDE